MESIEDIVAEMRKDIPRVVDAKVILRNYADRIEQAVTNCNQLKTREALKFLRDASREFHHLILNSKHNEICDKYKYPAVAKISDAIANAGIVLAEPARNCDVYASEEEAFEGWKRYFNLDDNRDDYLGYEDWLFAKAKGEGTK